VREHRNHSPSTLQPGSMCCR